MIVCCVFDATIAAENVQDEAGGSFVLAVVLAGFVSPLGVFNEVLPVLESERSAGWCKLGVVVIVGGWPGVRADESVCLDRAVNVSVSCFSDRISSSSEMLVSPFNLLLLLAAFLNFLALLMSASAF
jgi:hypothetical protein